MKKGLRRHITLLILQDEATEAFTLRIPTYLFHFLVLLLVSVFIGAGLATVWLGEITVKLQAMDVVGQENKRLRTQLAKASQLQEELIVLEERERRILNLAQAFLDDTTANASTVAAPVNGEIYDESQRSKLVASVLGRERDMILNRFRETKSSLPPHLASVRPTLGWKSLQVPVNLEAQFQGAAAKPVLVPPGDPILAPLSGLVTYAGWDPVLGLTVTLHNEGAYSVSIGHLGELNVRKGDFLRMGSPLGRSMTGNGEAGSYILLRLQRLDLAIPPSGVLIE